MKPALYISFLIFSFLAVSCTTTTNLTDNEEPQKIVKGIFVDANQFEQSDAEIRIIGTERTTKTDHEGKFEIEASKGDILKATNNKGEVVEYYITNPNEYIRIVGKIVLLN
ncbi:MAG: hypothetical protein WCY25_03540 [Moheibacter sp.]